MKSINKGQVLTIILALSMFLLFIIKQNTATKAITNDQGQVLLNSITALEKVQLGEMDQWILIRGENKANPVILWLHGGPGSAQIPIANHFNGALEKDFTVVHWDQRGAGKSNPFNFNVETMTLEQFIQDTHELTLYLKERFNQDRIYLVGHSWGAQLGILVANQYPQDYFAYIGVSQVVENKKASRLAYEWLVNEINEKNGKKDLKAIERIGTPPYFNHKNFVEFAKLVDAYGGGMDIAYGRLLKIALGAREYSLVDYISWLRGAARGSGPMWQETFSLDLFTEVTSLQLPVYFFSGKNDYNTPLQLVEAYFEQLDAPKGKKLIIFEASSHAPFMGEPEKFNKEILKVKEETYEP